MMGISSTGGNATTGISMMGTIAGGDAIIDASRIVGTEVGIPGVPNWVSSRLSDVVASRQRSDEWSRSMEVKVREEPKSGEPGSVRASMTLPNASRTVILRDELGMLTAVVTRLGATVSVVLGSLSA